MIPIDLQALIAQGLAADRREPDGLLHASSDLIGSLRHSQLRFVGAPELERNFVSDVRLMTGTLWHEYIHGLLQKAGMPFMEEIDLTPWMPEGWSGTADWLFFDPELEAFVLGDLKTSKGESMEWKEKNGMSQDHYYQLSAYWHALVEAGFPMVDEFFLMYLPITAPKGNVNVEPVICTARPSTDVLELMAERWDAVYAYASTRDDANLTPSQYFSLYGLGEYDLTTLGQVLDNDLLAPTQERVQKLFWKKDGMKWEVKLVPHWSAAYCPFDNGLCDCSEQGETKIGEWVMTGDEVQMDVYWVARKGYDIAPEVRPDAKEIRYRLRA